MAERRARAARHDKVEFRVDSSYYRTFDEACGAAVVRAASSGKTAYIDVLIYSPAGARWWGGEDAVEEYEDDPDASVFERIAIKADSKGRVP